LVTSREEEAAQRASEHLGQAIRLYCTRQEIAAQMIGPAPAALSKVNDIYRRVIYIKQEEYDTLIGIKNYFEGYFLFSQQFVGCNLQFDFDPMSSY
jgi:Primosomal protein N'' (replication factor Y) - superfamily II helicase